MLDINNGCITLDENKIKLSKGMHIIDFSQSTLFNDVYATANNPGATIYHLKPQLIGEYKFGITLIFNPRGKLKSLSLSLNEKGEITPFYENWSEERERTKKMKHDEWLRKNFGDPPYKYAWGEIGSYYYQQSASSEITIKYNIT